MISFIWISEKEISRGELVVWKWGLTEWAEGNFLSDNFATVYLLKSVQCTLKIRFYDMKIMSGNSVLKHGGVWEEKQTAGTSVFLVCDEEY